MLRGVLAAGRQVLDMVPHWFRFWLESDVNLMGSELPTSSKQAMQVISYIAHHVIFIKYT